MAYEAEKDVELAIVGVMEVGRETICVRLMQYDSGPVKIDVKRTYPLRNGNVRTSDLGRVTPHEARGLLVLYNSALEAIERNGLRQD